MKRIDGAIQYLLNNQEPHTAGQHSELPAWQNFPLTEQSDFSQLFSLPLEAGWLDNGELRIRIPACIPTRDITAPDHSTAVELLFMQLSCDTSNIILTSMATSQVHIPYDTCYFPGKELHLPYSNLSMHFSLIAVSLRFIPASGKKMPPGEEPGREPAMIAWALMVS
jgi:hypothetical protein